MNATPEDKGLMAIWGYSLSKDSKNKDAAFKFLMQSVDFEMWKTIHETTGLAIPNGTIEDSEWAIDNSYSPGAYATNVNSSGSIWPISKTAWAETEPVRDISREYMEKVLTGEITAEEYVQMTGDAIEELMSEAGHF
jgi:spermidine/putrescine-binding protein